MTIPQIILTIVLSGFGFLFILAIVGGKRCVHCDRHLPEDGKCINTDCHADHAKTDSLPKQAHR
jgi:hypothetical protein